MKTRNMYRVAALFSAVALLVLLAACYRYPPPVAVSFPDDPRVLHGEWLMDVRLLEPDETERTCRENGLLLTPSADLLFDRGWISFRDGGQLLVASELPGQVRDRIGLDLTPGRDCGSFTSEQARFLEYHRDCIFEQGLPDGTAHAF